MSDTVRVNNLTVSHKGSNGFSVATLPDVCKTPSPGGPIPIPYPNISRSGSLTKGTKTVKADGGNMVAIKGSEYTTSNGDEPGTAGGVVSSTFAKESTWITYSFDVKLDGQNACRLTDKKFQNHKNTVDLGGDIEIPILAGVSNKDLQDLADECNKRVNKKAGVCPKGPKGRKCTTLGTKKHKCCEKAIEEYNKKNPGSPLQSEVAFSGPGVPAPPGAASAARKAADRAYKRFVKNRTSVGKVAKATARAAARKQKVWWKAFRKAGGGKFIADVLVVTPPGPPPADNIKKAYDFKFNCADEPKMSEKQKGNYKTYTGKKVRTIHSDGRKCP